jgi:quinol-cytochrome oxidoreductase complex cytochrome b subunit
MYRELNNQGASWALTVVLKFLDRVIFISDGLAHFCLQLFGVFLLAGDKRELIWGVVLPFLFVVLFIIYSFINWGAKTEKGRRPVAMALAVTFMIGFGGLSIIALMERGG